MWACMQARRQKDLKVIVMSATLDAAKFAGFFGSENVVHLMVQPSCTSLFCKLNSCRSAHASVTAVPIGRRACS